MSTTAKNYKIIHADERYCTRWAVALLLSESRAIINDLDVILHGFILQIIYITFFLVKRYKYYISRDIILEHNKKKQ